ncbi:hypothetical protein HX744_26145 [Pseudonocardia sp. ICBG1122]|nr:hypothetical protein [Pseudonocardia pini]
MGCNARRNTMAAGIAGVVLAGVVAAGPAVAWGDTPPPQPDPLPGIGLLTPPSTTQATPTTTTTPTTPTPAPVSTTPPAPTPAYDVAACNVRTQELSVLLGQFSSLSGQLDAQPANSPSYQRIRSDLVSLQRRIDDLADQISGRCPASGSSLPVPQVPASPSPTSSVPASPVPQSTLPSAPLPLVPAQSAPRGIATGDGSFPD